MLRMLTTACSDILFGKCEFWLRESVVETKEQLAILNKPSASEASSVITSSTS